MFNFNVEKTTETTAFDNVKKWDMLIVGGGPAGLNAALYAKRKGMEVGILTDEIGGQLHNTATVDNYLGISDVEGADLSDKFLDHVQKLDVPILKSVRVEQIDHRDPDFDVLLTNGRVFRTKTVLIATGGFPRKLGVPGEKEFNNKGVTYCAICDAPFFKDKDVIVAGGGNAAAEGVLDLVPWAKSITVVHRSQWRADSVLLEKLNEIDKLTVHLETQIKEVYGDDTMQGIKAYDKVNDTMRDFKAEGLLIEIGRVPNTGYVKDLVETNDNNEILVDSNQETSIKGLYAAGDVVSQPFKQVVISSAEGAKAALAANQYLNSNYKENENYGRATT